MSPLPLPSHNVPAIEVPQESLNDLQEELVLQQVLKDSCSDVGGDHGAVAEIETEIRNIKKKIQQHKRAAALQAQTRPQNSGQGERIQATKHRIPHHTPKRPHASSHGQSSLPPAKSRRTTPSPMGDRLSSSPMSNSGGVIGFNASSPIDLTGDNDDQGWRRQLAEARRIEERRRQEEKDAAIARQMEFGSPSSDSAESMVHQESATGRSAFDRMVPQYHSPNRPAAPPSSASRMAAGAPASTAQFGSPSAIRGPGLSAGMSSSSSGPGFAKYSADPSSNSPFPTGTNVSSRNSPSGFSMPGAFDDSLQDFLTSSAGTSGTNSPWGTTPGLTVPGTSFGAHAPIPPMESARRAALQRQMQVGQPVFINSSTLVGPNSASGHQFGNGIRPSDMYVNGTRPGMMYNGSTIPFSQPTPSSNLIDLTRRTAGNDYVNGLDSYGNPLPAWMRDFANDIMDDPRNNEEQIQELLANIRPDMDLPTEDRADDPEDLRYPLYKHQRIALSWMQMMEKDEKKKGGILADDMGLGKTISSLSLIVSRKARPAEGARLPKAKTTLIVGPLALVRQWEREIGEKLRPSFALSVRLHHGKKQTFTELRGYDVVLTTYGTLASELSKMEKYVKEQREKQAPVDDHYLMGLCPLTGPKSLWYRVILDEAQCIKNAKTKTAKAAFELKAEYRWCLSGTPMMNSTSELASLIQFLRIRPYSDPKRFSQHFNCLSTRSAAYGNKSAALEKLQILLKAIMLRRTKSSKLDGKPILELPPKIEEVVHVQFGEEESSYYQDLEKHSQVQVSKFLKDGTTGKKYQVILTLLLRLRQACCHPYLHITDLESGGNSEVSQDRMAELAQTLSQDVVSRIKQIDAFECPICFDATENPNIMLPCGHDMCSECFANFTSESVQRNIQAGREDSTDVSCPECRGRVEVSKVITYDVFKKVHMPHLVEEAPKDEEEVEEFSDSSDDESEEDSDDDMDNKGNLRGFIVDDDDDDDSIVDSADEGGRPAKARKTKAKKSKGKTKIASAAKGKQKQDPVKPHMLKKLRQESAKNQQARKRYMGYLKKIWEPSAKVSKCSELISSIQHTGEKTIVFSQWTLLLDLLELPLKNQLKIGYRRYDGSMSGVARDQAARDFMKKPDVKVILVSLKAGNAGLNLTAASQVIIMDPFWNPYIENQAVDRAHRIGQQKPVRVHRILIQGTVEDRIVELQDRKRELVDSALSEDASKKMGSLGASELRYLFGLG